MRKLVNLPEKPTVFIAADPPSHGKSYAGFTAGIYSSVGEFFILGMAEVNIEESSMAMLKTVTSTFAQRVLQQLSVIIPLHTVRVIAIVEANNNEFQSNDMAQAIRDTATGMGAKYHMPFTKSVFPRGVSDNIGVFTHNVEKHGGIQTILTLMVENRFVLWDRMVTIGQVHLAQHDEPSQAQVLSILHEQLTEYKETENGPSGKTAATNDDIASSLQMLAYHSFCVKMIEAMNEVRDTSVIPTKRRRDILAATERQAQMRRMDWHG
jgi:hypothetical protein